MKTNVNWIRILQYVACATLLASAAIGQEPEDAPQLIELTITPAAETQPALQYSLLPTYAEQQAGNAATYYMRAMLLRSQLRDIDIRTPEDDDRWMKWPMEAREQEEIRQWLNRQQAVFEDLRHGAYREDCDWGLRLRELQGIEVMQMRFLETSEARGLARALRLQARLAIAEGRLNDALESLRQGYQLAYHVNRQPTIINSLVAVAISYMMTSELQQLVQHEAAPNLYWAIASLPQPLVDMRAANEQERNFVFQLFPALKDAETAQHTPEEWQQLLDATISSINSTSGSSSADNIAEKLLMSTYAALHYPHAKKALIAAGMPAQQVEAMPVAQVLLVQTARATRYAYDEMFKWTYVPYAEAMPHILKTQERLRKEGLLASGSDLNNAALPIAALLLPAIEAATAAPVREQRRVAALQIIEALRLHAAATGGQLPQSLQEITEVPIPRDPAFGTIPTYRLDGDSAVLEFPAPPGKRQAHEGYRYVLRIRR